MWFGLALLGQYSTTAARRVDWDADTIKTTLHPSSLTPVQDTTDFYDDVDAADELSTAGGYTAGGFTHVTSAVTYDTATNEARLDADDASWSSATFTARHAITRKDTGAAATSPLLTWVNFGADESVASGTFTVQWDATGVAKLVAAL